MCAGSDKRVCIVCALVQCPDPDGAEKSGLPLTHGIAYKLNDRDKYLYGHENRQFSLRLSTETGDK